ncbi:MAG: cytochrome c [Bdellovibrionota bacterium]
MKNYIRESILNPQAKVVNGFALMPAYQGILKEREIEALIEFIKLQK